MAAGISGMHAVLSSCKAVHQSNSALIGSLVKDALDSTYDTKNAEAPYSTAEDSDVHQTLMATEKCFVGG